jgi:integrase
MNLVAKEYVAAQGEHEPGVLILSRFAGGGRGSRRSLDRQSLRCRWSLAVCGIATEVCNHTFRGTGITAYLENGGTLEKARQMAAHASTRTTQLYDRREDRVTLDEVVKINIRG